MTKFKKDVGKRKEYGSRQEHPQAVKSKRQSTSTKRSAEPSEAALGDRRVMRRLVGKTRPPTVDRESSYSTGNRISLSTDTGGVTSSVVRGLAVRSGDEKVDDISSELNSLTGAAATALSVVAVGAVAVASRDQEKARNKRSGDANVYSAARNVSSLDPSKLTGSTVASTGNAAGNVPEAVNTVGIPSVSKEDDTSDISNICVFCFSYNCQIRISPDSAQCHEMQRKYGCHSCGALECWTQNPRCFHMQRTLMQGIDVAWAASSSLEPISKELGAYVQRRFSPSEHTQCRMRCRELGGEGDCLFHSFAGALGHMLMGDDKSVAHVFSKIAPDVWRGGQQAIMMRLRTLSADALYSWTHENLLDYVLCARMQQQMGSFADHWNPHGLLV